MDIWEAAANGNIETIKELLNEGVDVNIKNIDGSTPLMYASRYSNSSSSLDTVNFLLNHGADPNLQNDSGVTSLMMSSRHVNDGDSSLDTIKMLLDNGADPNLGSKTGYTALMYSAISGSSDAIKLLLDRGANIDMKTSGGMTALMFAIRNSNTTSSLDVIILLLERGANPFEKVICPTKECYDIIDEARWVRLSKRDKQLAEKYNREIPITKDVWLLIMRHKRQQQLCSNLKSDGNKEILKYFALELEIPLEDIQNLSKGQLCGLISRQITFRNYGKIQSEKEKDRIKLLEVARRYGIDINNPINKILNDLAKIF